MNNFWKNLIWISAVLVCLIGAAISAIKIDFRAKFTKCEESVIAPQSVVINNNYSDTDAGSAIASSVTKALVSAEYKCSYPSRAMRIKGVWICSCRSDEETKRGIE